MLRHLQVRLSARPLSVYLWPEQLSLDFAQLCEAVSAQLVWHFAVQPLPLAQKPPQVRVGNHRFHA